MKVKRGIKNDSQMSFLSNQAVLTFPKAENAKGEAD